MTDWETQGRQQAAEQIANAQHQQDVGKIVELGHLEYGRKTFDEASNMVASKLGSRTAEFMAMARQFDQPHRLVAELANDERTLETLARAPSARMVAEIARVEARMAPYGYVGTGAAPAYKTADTTGRVSDDEWKATGGANLSDKAWHKEFDRRYGKGKR